MALRRTVHYIKAANVNGNVGREFRNASATIPANLIPNDVYRIADRRNGYVGIPGKPRRRVTYQGSHRHGRVVYREFIAKRR
jgi:hypothetical protein